MGYSVEPSDQAKAERAARGCLELAMNHLRAGQASLQKAGWEHDPFADAIDTVNGTYLSLQDYSPAPMREGLIRKAGQ